MGIRMRAMGKQVSVWCEAVLSGTQRLSFIQTELSCQREMPKQKLENQSEGIRTPDEVVNETIFKVPLTPQISDFLTI